MHKLIELDTNIAYDEWINSIVFKVVGQRLWSLTNVRVAGMLFFALYGLNWNFIDCTAVVF